MPPRILLVATRPFRAFFNQRFADLQQRLATTETRLDDALAELRKQSEDMAETQRALMDALTLLGSAIAENRTRTPAAEPGQAPAVRNRTNSPRKPLPELVEG